MKSLLTGTRSPEKGLTIGFHQGKIAAAGRLRLGLILLALAEYIQRSLLQYSSQSRKADFYGPSWDSTLLNVLTCC